MINITGLMESEPFVRLMELSLNLPTIPQAGVERWLRTVSDGYAGLILGDDIHLDAKGLKETIMDRLTTFAQIIRLVPINEPADLVNTGLMARRMDEMRVLVEYDADVLDGGFRELVSNTTSALLLMGRPIGHG